MGIIRSFAIVFVDLIKLLQDTRYKTLFIVERNIARVYIQSLLCNYAIIIMTFAGSNFKI